MNGILGMSELLLDTQLDEAQRGFAQHVRGSCEALLAIVNDILDFSSMESGRFELESVDFDVREIVREVVALFSARAHAKGLRLDLRMDQNVPADVRGDPGRTRQVLMNIVGNAVKFTKAGGVDVELSCVASARGAVNAGECDLHFCVRDTGIGMPQEVRNRVFSAFTQADGSMSRRFGGLGLGLVISRQLITMMGGEIEAESVPGEGSTFRFSIRVETLEAPVRQ
jgi:two-component system, sensor histidine kinase and response regulator